MGKQKILIVEDESLILRDILLLYDWEHAGYEPITASNGQQGLSLFIQEQPQLVITDVRMPHMDGLTMLAHIRRLSPDAKFIILSAYGDFDYAREALKLGVTDYLLKADLSTETIQSALASFDRVDSSDYSSQTDNAPPSPVVERAIEYIRSHYQEPTLRIGGISLACGISASRLSARFREEMNTTVNEYVTSIRIKNAKALLLSGKYKVYEVAYLVGYKNQAYFSTLFQEQTGMKPNKYHEKTDRSINTDKDRQ